MTSIYDLDDAVQTAFELSHRFVASAKIESQINSFDFTGPFNQSYTIDSVALSLEQNEKSFNVLEQTQQAFLEFLSNDQYEFSVNKTCLSLAVSMFEKQVQVLTLHALKKTFCGGRGLNTATKIIEFAYKKAKNLAELQDTVQNDPTVQNKLFGATPVKQQPVVSNAQSRPQSK